MLKKTLFILIAGFLMACVSGLAVSAEKGNPRKGKYTYKKSCRSCHSDGGTAVSLSPDSYTQAQWERLFTKKYKKLECKDQWESLSEADRGDIFTYLHKYALDSPTPAKCK